MRPTVATRSIAALWANLAELRTHRRGRLGELVAARRTARLDDAVVEVPLLAGDVHDLDGLDEIGAHLFPRDRTDVR